MRVALGAVGGAAFRAPELEQALEGRPADEETARLFAEGCVAAVQQSIPGRYSLPYKQHAAVGLAYDAWNMLALERALRARLGLEAVRPARLRQVAAASAAVRRRGRSGSGSSCLQRAQLVRRDVALVGVPVAGVHGPAASAPRRCRRGTGGSACGSGSLTAGR